MSQWLFTTRNETISVKFMLICIKADFQGKLWNCFACFGVSWFIFLSALAHLGQGTGQANLQCIWVLQILITQWLEENSCTLTANLRLNWTNYTLYIADLATSVHTSQKLSILQEIIWEFQQSVHKYFKCLLQKLPGTVVIPSFCSSAFCYSWSSHFYIRR